MGPILMKLWMVSDHPMGQQMTSLIFEFRVANFFSFCAAPFLSRFDGKLIPLFLNSSILFIQEYDIFVPRIFLKCRTWQRPRKSLHISGNLYFERRKFLPSLKTGFSSFLKLQETFNVVKKSRSMLTNESPMSRIVNIAPILSPLHSIFSFHH